MCLKCDDNHRFESNDKVVCLESVGGDFGSLEKDKTQSELWYYWKDLECRLFDSKKDLKALSLLTLMIWTEKDKSNVSRTWKRAYRNK